MVNQVQVPKEQLDVELDDLEVVATLGVGGFGRVELVKCRKKPGVTYALKCLKKQHIVETQQQEHVFSEKNILMSCRHNFITRYSITNTVTHHLATHPPRSEDILRKFWQAGWG